MVNTLTETDDLILKFNEEQLRLLNRKIVERLKLIRRAKSSVSLACFNLGDRVYFLYEGRKMLGAIIRLNQKIRFYQIGRRPAMVSGAGTANEDY